MSKLKFIILSLFAMVTLMSCGGEEKKEEVPQKIKLKEKKATPEINDSIANVVLTGDDSMKFNKNEIKVKSGQKVKLTLRHIGKMNKMTMGHNVVILKKDVNVTVFAGLAAVAGDNDYIPKDSNDIIAHTKLIGAGETTVIEFLAPEAGTYDFICSFPAHFATMRGKFIVEAQ